MSHRHARRRTRRHTRVRTRLLTRLIPWVAVFATLPSQATSQYREAVVAPVPTPRLTQHVASDTNGRTAGASFAAVAGSFLGLVAGSVVVYGTNDLGNAMLVLSGSTWAGAALGAGLVTGNGSRAVVGSLAGLAAGVGAAALVSRFGGGTGALISFSVVHGLVTATIAH